MKKMLLALLAAVALLAASSDGLSQTLPGGDAKPLVTISFSGYDEVLADIDFVGKLGGNPALGETLEDMLKEKIGGEGLVGLDASRPWGAVVQPGGAMGFSVVGFVPVTDLDALMGLLKVPETGEPIAQKENGIYKIVTPDGPTISIAQKGGWAFIVTEPDALDNTPADPIALLGGLNQKYDLAARVSIQSIPAPLREKFKDALKMGAAAGMRRMPGESEEEYKIRTGVARTMVDRIASLVDELDEVLLGVAIDRTAGTSYLDFEITAVEGTRTAEQFAAVKSGPTRFGGLDIPGAALIVRGVGTLTDDDVTDYKALIGNIRTMAEKELNKQDLTPAELQLASQMVDDLFDWIDANVEKRTSDVGLTVLLKPDGITAVGGATIAEGAKLDKLIKQLIELAIEEDPDIADVLAMDAEVYDGVQFHILSVPVPDEEAVRFFGENLEVVVGIGDDTLYIAAGKDAVKTLKKVMDDSKAQAGKQVEPLLISVAATPIAKFAAEVAEGLPAFMAAGMAAQLEQSGGKDHLKITAEPTTGGNGIRVRVEIEEGLLKLLGGLSNMLGMMGAGDEAPF
ncbi:MAG TPA: hypothetical protein VMY42_16775 [Thermoguttaceae bacterium]|nr:hypothetical protein [Thermoguttaceae bacterium]